MQTITPFLWFDDKAEEAANFYVSVFSAIGGGDSKLGSMTRYSDEASKASGRPKGTVMTAAFRLNGQDFVALNGGPQFKFTEAVSFVVNCKTQEEIDEYWQKLSAGGKEGPCGWLKDKYGLSWQVVPTMLSELLGGKDAAKSQRAMKALLQMKKIDVKTLQQA